MPPPLYLDGGACAHASTTSGCVGWCVGVLPEKTDADDDNRPAKKLKGAPKKELEAFNVMSSNKTRIGGRAARGWGNAGAGGRGPDQYRGPGRYILKKYAVIRP